MRSHGPPQKVLTNMTHRNRQPQCVAQRGYAMLGIIALIGVAATVTIITSLSATAVRNEQSRKTSSALALAKQALIASAASSNTRPGSLPCPDTDNDGQANADASGCAATVGRLPWLTLGLPDLRDAGNERLWYALSPQFRDGPENIINSSTLGALNITGTISANNVVAIVFAPGAPVGTQARGTGQINSVSQYIESYVSPTSYSTNSAGDAYNDQLITISAIDIFLVVERRVATEVQNALKAYSNSYPAPGRLPPYALNCTGGGPVSCPKVVPAQPTPAVALPAAGTPGYIPTDDPVLILPAWFSANNWNAVITYRVDSNCAAGLACGTTAFASYPPSTSDGILIGFSGGLANAGTKAVLSFSGVNAVYPNYQATVLNAALQVP